MGAAGSCAEVRKSCNSCTLEAGSRTAPERSWSAPKQDGAYPPAQVSSSKPQQSHAASSSGSPGPGAAADTILHMDGVEIRDQDALSRIEDYTWKAGVAFEEEVSRGTAVAPGRAPSKGSAQSADRRGGEKCERIAEGQLDEPEPAPEAADTDTHCHYKGRGDDEVEDLDPCNLKREKIKAVVGLLVVVFFWAAVFVPLSRFQAAWEPPRVCEDSERRLADARGLGTGSSLIVVAAPPRACEHCAEDLIFLPFYGEYERNWPKAVRGPLYFLGLLWTFLGIGMICDAFMAAIEEITSFERLVWLEVRKGSRHKFHVKFWNPTIANLSLMALGSSAPEILLSVIEVLSLKFFAGALGPSTIVGSAAFNLLIITAVCVSAIPPGEVRKVAQVDVFLVTASFSIFAYLWMLIVLLMYSPHKVDLEEAVITLMLFPVLLCVAFAADKGQLRKLKFWGSKAQEVDANAEIAKIQAKYGKELPSEALKMLLKQSQSAQAETNAPTSRLKLRQGVMSGMTGGRDRTRTAVHPGQDQDLVFGFEEAEHVALECAGVLQLKVVASRAPTTPVSMKYSTFEGTARAGQRYEHREGILRFNPGQTENYVEVSIIDDDNFQEDESFRCELSDIIMTKNPISPGRTSRRSGGEEINVMKREPRLGMESTTITVLNDDMPGTLSFDADEVYATEGHPATVGINRTHGSTGRITCEFSTVECSAMDGRDFTHTEGVIELEEGQLHATIEVPILRSKHHYAEGEERFQVVLQNPSLGVKFDKHRDGGEERTICDVMIPPSRKPNIGWRIVLWFCDEDRFRSNFRHWQDQFVFALYCNGGPREQAEAGLQDWILHCVSLTFKVPVSFIPPPTILGGWACFVGALATIGVVTAIVGDLATMLGCCMDIPDDITAITLVALGTSLPDTFASKLAAQQDSTADNSVGNVTGSNSVNVFLGLGVPWTIASIYWKIEGPTQIWKDFTSQGQRYEDLYPEYMLSGGGFIVPAGSLALSVAVFTGCAMSCLMILAWRRHKYGGELGGPKFAQTRDSTIMCGLWFVYIITSVIVSLSQ